MSVSRIIHARRELPPPAARRALRLAAGLSQAELAREIGVTAQAVSLWEAGRRRPRAGNVVAYVQLLGELRRLTIVETDGDVT